MPANRTIDSKQVRVALFFREHWSLNLFESLVLVALDASHRAYHADLPSGDSYDRKDRHRTSHLATRNYRSIRRRPIVGTSIATCCRSTRRQSGSGRFGSRRDGGNQNRRQHHFHKTIWKRISAAHGARLSPDQPDVALHGTAPCEQPHRDLRRSPRLWAQRVPASAEDHYPYSKRAMANELLAVMDKLGFSRFDLVGHDRGGRVSYRLALDHPEKVQRLAVFDVIPISEGWGHADAKFAMTYWPWILLSQKAPLPEKYLSGAPGAVFDDPFGQGSFGPKVRAEYTETYRDPARVHAICEEYRAAATLDIEHDNKDRDESRRITCPMLHLWSSGGPLDTFYEQDGGSLGIWRKWADHVEGEAVKGGHFFPEENPAETTEILTRFLSA